MDHKSGIRWRQVLLGMLTSFAFLMAQEAQAQPKKKTLPSVEKIQSKTPKQEMSEHTEDLRALMQDLYEAHPEELAKSTQVGPREMTEWVFDGKANWRFEAIRRKQGVDAIELIFDPQFTGDHILALVVGLETLLFDTYGGKNEFDIPPQRDQGRLMQARCQLQSLHARLATYQVAGLGLASPRQIQGVLNNIIQRLGDASDEAISNC